MKQQEARIRKFMMDLGIGPELNGYHYLVEAILIVHKSMAEGDIRKPIIEIYEQIAARFNTTKSRVDRSIRYAKERSFDNPSVAHNEYFGVLIDFENGIVTNGCFINTLAEHLRMGDGDERRECC